MAVINIAKNTFDETSLKSAISRYRGLEKLKDGQFVKFDEIIIVQDGKIVYEKPM